MAHVGPAGAAREAATAGPALTFNLTLSLIGALSAFDTMLAMTRGGPARATEVINFDVWKTFGQGYFAESAALGLVLFVLSVLFAIPLIIACRRREVRAVTSRDACGAAAGTLWEIVRYGFLRRGVGGGRPARCGSWSSTR